MTYASILPKNIKEGYCTYLIHNLKNNKIYIGKTINVKKRWIGHLKSSASKNKDKQLIHHSIKKYGMLNFTFSVVQYYNNENDMNLGEIYWIEYYKSNIKKYGIEFGYNLTAGGEKLNGENNPFYGKKHNEKTKKILSEINFGKNAGEKHINSKLKENQIIEIINKYHTGNYGQRDLAKEYNIGRTTIVRIIKGESWQCVPQIERSPEDIIIEQKNRKIKKIKLMSGQNNPFYGKSHSSESIEKIKSSNKGKLDGEKSPCSKLKEYQVIEIINKYNTGNYTIIKLSEEYSVGKTTIKHILDGNNWKHVARRQLSAQEIAIFETNKKIKKSIRMSGKNNPFYGKKHSPETIEQIKNTNLNKN